MKKTLRAENPRYKWVVAAACFVMIFVGLGFCSSNKSMYLGAITQALGIKRSLFSLNDSFRYIATAVVNLFFGALIGKFGTRKLVGAGFICLVASVTVNIFAVQVWQFWIGGVLLGVGMSFCSTTMVSYLVGRWMPEKRGTVTGAILCANGLGGALAAQIINPMINDPANAFGYRRAYTMVAILVLVVGCAVTAFIREPRIQSRSAQAKKQRGRQWTGLTLRQALKKPYFYAAGACVLLTGMALQGIHGIAATHMYDVGLNKNYVATVLSVSSLVLTGSKFLVGFSYDKLGLRITVTISDLFGSAAFLCLAFVGMANVGNVLAMGYGVMASLALPLETVLVPLIAADLFGEKEFAKLLGIFVSLNTAGYALGTPVANLVFEAFGSYSPVLFFFGIMMAVIALVFQFIMNGARKAQKQAEAAEITQ